MFYEIYMTWGTSQKEGNVTSVVMVFGWKLIFVVKSKIVIKS